MSRSDPIGYVVGFGDRVYSRHRNLAPAYKKALFVVKDNGLQVLPGRITVNIWGPLSLQPQRIHYPFNRVPTFDPIWSWDGAGEAPPIPELKPAEPVVFKTLDEVRKEIDKAVMRKARQLSKVLQKDVPQYEVRDGLWGPDSVATYVDSVFNMAGP